MNPLLFLLLVLLAMAGPLSLHAQDVIDLPPVEKTQPKPQPAPRRPSGPVEVNGIAAKVNGRVITKNQVAFMLAPIYGQLVAQFPRRGQQFEAQFKEAREKILQELVDRQIILDEFKQLGASIKPNLVDEEIKRQIHELYNGDEKRFRDELKRSRLTMEGYRDMTREKMVVQAMRQQQFSDAPPPLPKEVAREYAEMKTTLRDTSKDTLSFEKIFIPREDQSDPLATSESQLAVAEGLVKRINAGEAFQPLAKQYSKDAFAEQGGIQANLARTNLSPEFAAIIFNTPEGKVIGPLEDPLGFTIVRVTKKTFGPSPPLSKVHEMVEERVRRKKTSAQYERWISQRRKKAMLVLSLDK